MRDPPPTAAFGAAGTLSACAYAERERAVPARPAAVTTVPGAAVVTPGVVPGSPRPAAFSVR